MLMPNGSDLNYDQNVIDKKKGKLREIACKTWTTASGKQIYCGIPVYEYSCIVMHNGLTTNLILQYYPETLKWYLMEKQ